MRFLKNSFAAVLIICTLASCSIAFAATPSSENSLGMSPQAQENFSKAPYKVQEEILSSPELSAAAPYAYMDLYSAPESLQHDILAARDLIIHSQSWTTDPNDYTVYPDGSIEHDPLFSDLFPGWDLPTLENSILETPSFSISQPLAMTTLSIQMVQSNMILSSLICSQGGISPRLRIPSLKPPLSPSPSHWH